MAYSECTCKDLVEQLQNETTSAKILDKINREKISDIKDSVLIEEIIDSKKSNEDKLSKIIDENCHSEISNFKDIIRYCDRGIVK